VNQPLRAQGPASLQDVVNALGTRSFGPMLAAHADAAFGGHVFFACHYRDGQLGALAAGHVPEDPTNALIPNFWRYTHQREWEHDAGLSRGMSLLDARTADAHFHDRGGIESKRHWPWRIPTPLVDKVLLLRRAGGDAVVLEFSRWGDCGEFGAQQVDQAVEAGSLLMDLSIVHRRLLASRRDPLSAFQSCGEIERCLAHTTALTLRERQVCALQLLGANGSKIGAELGIAAESVKSYRKRAYLRLGVSCERELVLRFLSLRAAWQGRGTELDVPLDPWRMPFLLPPE